MRGLSVLAAIAAAGAGFLGVSEPAEGPGISAPTQKRMAHEATKPGKSDAKRSDMRALLGGGIGGPWARQRRAKPGWSNRYVKRMAVKRRNVARHRKASRG